MRFVTHSVLGPDPAGIHFPINHLNPLEYCKANPNAAVNTVTTADIPQLPFEPLEPTVRDS